MADDFNPADILSQLTDKYNDIIAKSVKNDRSSTVSDQAVYLASIDNTLKQILQNGKGMSYSNAVNSMPGSRSDANIGGVFRSKNMFGNTRKSFIDGFEDAMLEGILGSDFKNQIQDVMNEFANQVGVNIRDVPSALGKELGNQILGKFKDTQLGSSLFDKITNAKDSAINTAKSAYQEGVNKYTQTHSGTSTASEAASNVVSDIAGDVVGDFVGDKVKGTAGKVIKNVVGNTAKGAATSATSSTVSSAVAGATETAAMAGTATQAGAALSGLSNVLATANPYILAITVGLAALDYVLGPMIEGLQNFVGALGDVTDRTRASREAMVKEETERIRKDVESMVQEPFNIMKDAAQMVYNTWDQYLRKITGTQGYSKADLQTLMGNYSERLRSEGLSKVISTTDITESLGKVLDAGLSGKVAEEFAYIATKLNAAIPTQDFFNYASTYASLAANAIKNGASQSAAIKYANQELETFASSVLYASRQLTGGFSTGLTDAQTLFEQSVKIAQASKTGDAAQIAGVLTSVSAVVGAIAPDLSSSIVNAVYEAATGGNSSQLVALRSIAGINASNTEFIRQLAQNPQGVFTQLFQGLADFQNMSPGNYMEVAEALADVFGIDAEAFQRIDFNYLAKAISEMNVNNNSLEENMKLLASGETTTSKEQLRIQQVNEYMIDEGLAYVLDNEVARSIQEHMWDQELAQQMMENEYAVNLKGAALEFLSSIQSTIENLLTIVFPWFKISDAITEIVATSAEAQAQKNDIKQLLELGKVGSGNAQDLYNLLTTDGSIDVVPDILTLMGGESQFAKLESLRNSTYANALTDIYTNAGRYIANAFTASYASSVTGGSNRINSLYKWGMIGKSTSNLISSMGMGTEYTGSPLSSLSNTALAQAKASSNIDKMIDAMEEYVQEGKSYEDWAGSSNRYGIKDLSAALKEAGYDENQVKQRYQDLSAQQAAQEQSRRYDTEESYWNLMLEKVPILEELQTKTNSLLEDIYNKETEFYDAWVDYFVNHTAYSAAYDHSSVTAIQNAEKKKGTDDAVLALANALTANANDLTDPQVQTNALLAEILKLVATIMQQNNNKTTSSQLSDSLSGLALGLLK